MPICPYLDASFLVPSAGVRVASFLKISMLSPMLPRDEAAQDVVHVAQPQLWSYPSTFST